MPALRPKAEIAACFVHYSGSWLVRPMDGTQRWDIPLTRVEGDCSNPAQAIRKMTKNLLGREILVSQFWDVGTYPNARGETCAVHFVEAHHDDVRAAEHDGFQWLQTDEIELVAHRWFLPALREARRLIAMRDLEAQAMQDATDAA